MKYFRSDYDIDSAVTDSLFISYALLALQELLIHYKCATGRSAMFPANFLLFITRLLDKTDPETLTVYFWATENIVKSKRICTRKGTNIPNI